MITRQCRGVWVAYWAYLMSSLVIFSWYEEVFLEALFNPSSDKAGNLVFSGGGQKIYPFTVASALLGVTLTGVAIWRLNKGLQGLLLAFLVARASTLAAFELYEVTFTGFGSLFFGWRAFEERIATSAGWLAVKIGYLCVIAPWARRRNAPYAIAAVAAALTLFIIWIAIGYKLPESGDLTAYLLNAATRLIYPIIPFLTVIASRNGRNS